MSVNAIEKALWQIGTSEQEAERFRAAPEAYVQEFRMDDVEQDMLIKLDVGKLARHNVSTLVLMMAFLAVKGPDSMPDYMRSMHSPQSD